MRAAVGTSPVIPTPSSPLSSPVGKAPVIPTLFPGSVPPFSPFFPVR